MEHAHVSSLRCTNTFTCERCNINNGILPTVRIEALPVLIFIGLQFTSDGASQGAFCKMNRGVAIFSNSDGTIYSKADECRTKQERTNIA